MGLWNVELPFILKLLSFCVFFVLKKQLLDIVLTFFKTEFVNFILSSFDFKLKLERKFNFLFVLGTKVLERFIAFSFKYSSISFSSSNKDEIKLS